MGAIGKALNSWSWKLASSFRRNCSGQDLLEYALMAGFIAVFIGALVPSKIVPSLCSIYTKINSLLSNSTAAT
jgi:Flp pilus assembly pilin Flp